MDEKLIERAVEAAKTAIRHTQVTIGFRGESGDDAFETGSIDPYCSEALAEAAVTAALAEVEASITAERDEKQGSPEHRPIVQHVALTPTDDGGWAPRTMAQVETGRITITRTLLDDGDDVIDLQRDGDAEHAVTALGMLAMASDWVLHDQDGDESKHSR